MKKSTIGKKYLQFTACMLFDHGGCGEVLRTLMLD
jgi:hypothetical protein